MRAALSRLQLRLYARHLAASKRPILVGPYYSELGFEVLYWLPFLNQLRADYHWPKNRLIALSRGGMAAAYDMAGAADVYDHLSVDTVRTQALAQQQAAHTSKQLRIQPWERHLVALAGTSLGLTNPLLFHPSWMYQALTPFWMDKLAFKHLAPQISPTPIAQLPLPAGLTLPEKFIAVRFYARATMQPHDDVLLYLKAHLRRLAAKHTLVFLNSIGRYDDHGDFLAPFGDNMVSLEAHLTPQTNLAVQLAVLQRAMLFVGTYGGLAQAALRCNVPAIACYTTWGGTAFAHVDLTHRLSLANGVPFHLVQPQALEQLENLW